mmetsp:Transcript_128139/g.362788  ORF Transcript_128139/g.362788 Transcript_128139/m.362788 type:complete len:379 (+) Transcript_128139:2-1138(+)
MWRRLPFRVAAAGCTSVLAHRTQRETRCHARPAGEVFVTYNVLSSHLASPSHYKRCPPEDLDASARLARVEKKLTSAVDRRAVVGLQEVSTDWAGDLHVFFASRGYQSVFAQYGAKFNGRMGVLLAYPSERFTARQVRLHHVADSLPATPKAAPETPRHLSPYGILSREGLADLLGINPENLNPNSRYAPRGPTVDALNPRQDREWSLAEGRQNMAVFAQLQPADGSGPFCVGVYHMPCLFGSVESRQAVNIHAMALRSALADFAGGEPFVLLGDFNLRPESSSYALLSGADLGHEDSPATPLYRRVHSDVPLTSAYAAVHGKEPGPWMLDYIWVSGSCDVVACPGLDMDQPRPSAAEPSDHLLLEASVQLPASRREP